MGDLRALRLEVAGPGGRAAAPRPEHALGLLGAGALAGEPARLRVLRAHHVVVAKVGGVLLEAGAVHAELGGGVGAGRRAARVLRRRRRHRLRRRPLALLASSFLLGGSCRANEHNCGVTTRTKLLCYEQASDLNEGKCVLFARLPACLPARDDSQFSAYPYSRYIQEKETPACLPRRTLVTRFGAVIAIDRPTSFVETQ